MFSFILHNEIQMFFRILTLWHNNEHVIIAVSAMAQWLKLVSINLKVAGTNRGINMDNYVIIEVGS